MNDNQILVVHSRGVYNFVGLIMYHNSPSLFCYHAFEKYFQILPHFTSYVRLKTLIGFALVYQGQ